MSGTTDVAGKVGRARHFNAGDRIMAPPILVPAIDFTVAAWFRWTANPSPYYSGIQGGGYSWELRIMDDGRFAADWKNVVYGKRVDLSWTRISKKKKRKN